MTERVQARWGTAVGLTAAVVLLSALDAVPLVMVPVAMVLLAMPHAPRWRWMLLGALLLAAGVAYTGGPLGGVSRGWALLLGSGFLLSTLWRPRWGVLPRALLALALALAVAGGWLGVTGEWRAMDQMVREHLETMSRLAFGPPDAPASGLPAGFAEAASRMAALQWKVFPALLGLQSLSALALASWGLARLRRGEEGPFSLRPLREFRFNDQLVWVAVAGLVLLALPVGALATRLGYNTLLFMGGLYALRGAGIFLFLAGGSFTALSAVLATMVAVFLYPLVLTTAVLLGLSDTWLDVRARAAAAPQA